MHRYSADIFLYSGPSKILGSVLTESRILLTLVVYGTVVLSISSCEQKQ